MFFKPKPNLPDAEKARIEFHMQQLAESIGSDRFRRPVISRQQWIKLYESQPSVEQMMQFVGNHLSHDTSGIRCEIVPQATGNCGGGG